jgi:hypothetical protein
VPFRPPKCEPAEKGERLLLGLGDRVGFPEENDGNMIIGNSA